MLTLKKCCVLVCAVAMISLCGQRMAWGHKEKEPLLGAELRMGTVPVGFSYEDFVIKVKPSVSVKEDYAEPLDAIPNDVAEESDAVSHHSDVPTLPYKSITMENSPNAVKTIPAYAGNNFQKRKLYDCGNHSILFGTMHPKPSFWRRCVAISPAVVVGCVVLGGVTAGVIFAPAIREFFGKLLGSNEEEAGFYGDRSSQWELFNETAHD